MPPNAWPQHGPHHDLALWPEGECLSQLRGGEGEKQTSRYCLQPNLLNLQHHWARSVPCLIGFLSLFLRVGVTPTVRQCWQNSAFATCHFWLSCGCYCSGAVFFEEFATTLLKLHGLRRGTDTNMRIHFRNPKLSATDVCFTAV